MEEFTCNQCSYFDCDRCICTYDGRDLSVSLDYDPCGYFDLNE